MSKVVCEVCGDEGVHPITCLAHDRWAKHCMEEKKRADEAEEEVRRLKEGKELAIRGWNTQRRRAKRLRVRAECAEAERDKLRRTMEMLRGWATSGEELNMLDFFEIMKRHMVKKDELLGDAVKKGVKKNGF